MREQLDSEKKSTQSFNQQSIEEKKISASSRKKLDSETKSTQSFNQHLIEEKKISASSSDQLGSDKKSTESFTQQLPIIMEANKNKITIFKSFKSE